ncbi:MAG TPA: class I lanthipeptide [Polyangia bacterium]|jgi:hypothetical protein|nr:class I lanthipeptide [Polyangia bacterium]
MKKTRSTPKKLSLSKETVRSLADAQLQRAAGGGPLTDTCTTSGACSPTANCSYTC